MAQLRDLCWWEHLGCGQRERGTLGLTGRLERAGLCWVLQTPHPSGEDPAPCSAGPRAAQGLGGNGIRNQGRLKPAATPRPAAAAVCLRLVLWLGLHHIRALRRAPWGSGSDNRSRRPGQRLPQVSGRVPSMGDDGKGLSAQELWVGGQDRVPVCQPPLVPVLGGRGRCQGLSCCRRGLLTSPVTLWLWAQHLRL